jgi:hypothetical protein
LSRVTASHIHASSYLAKRRAARIAKKVAREKSQSGLDDGLNDLPLAVALAIEEIPAQPDAEPTPVQPDDSTVDALVRRLTMIRERIWQLQSVFAVSLSQDAAFEANRYLALFQDLAEQLKAKDPSALDDLVRNHESLLLAPALPLKQSIPLDTQRLCEIRWQASTQPSPKAPKRPTVPDGLDWLVG